MTFTTVMVRQLGRRLKTAPIAKMIPSRIAKTKQMPVTAARRGRGDIEGAKTGAKRIANPTVIAAVCRKRIRLPYQPPWDCLK
jgi:hypothetical protein